MGQPGGHHPYSRAPELQSTAPRADINHQGSAVHNASGNELILIKTSQIEQYRFLRLPKNIDGDDR